MPPADTPTTPAHDAEPDDAPMPDDGLARRRSRSGVEPTEMEKIIDERLKVKLKEIEDAKKAEAKAAEGMVVGDGLKLICDLGLGRVPLQVG